METKLIFTVLNIVGITSYISAILLNTGNWKADVLWFLAVLFGVVKFLRYSVKTWQDYRKEELDIRLKKKEIEKS